MALAREGFRLVSALAEGDSWDEECGGVGREQCGV